MEGDGWMTGLHASIRIHPGTDRQFEASTPQAVGELVDILTQPESDDAYIEHASRPREMDDGEEFADHVLYAAVRDQVAYLRYLGPVSGAATVEDAVVPIGDPDSPETSGTNNVVYPASTGLNLARFTEVLREFARTAELPTSVQWTTETDLANGNPAPLPRT